MQSYVNFSWWKSKKKKVYETVESISILEILDALVILILKAETDVELFEKCILWKFSLRLMLPTRFVENQSYPSLDASYL